MSRSQRNFQAKNGHLTAIVVGIILVILGLYFLIGLSDATTGLIMTLAGVAFVVIGCLIKRSKKKD